jgi:hypothetical protein
MRQRTTESRFDFRGGLNTASSEDLLDLTEFRYGKNVQVSTRGSLVKRAGTKRLHDTQLGAGAPVLGLSQWDAPGQAGQVVAVCNGIFHYLNRGATDFVAINNVRVIGTLAIDAVPEKFKTTTEAKVSIAGAVITKAATTALVFSAAHVITANLYGVVLIQINAAGAISTKVPVSPQAYATAAAALAALPAPDAGNVALGYIAIANNAGDWTANTDDLANGVDVTTAAFVDATVTVLSTTNRVRFATHRIGTAIVLYFADGALRQWDGTTLTTAISGAPAARDIRLYKSRGHAHDATKRDYYSKIADLTDWSNLNGGFADVETYDTEPLVALGVIGSSLVMAKPNSLARFTGVDATDIQIDKESEGISPTLGCAAQMTFIELDEALFNLSDRGPYLVNESGVEPCGRKIEDQFDASALAYIGSALAVHDRGTRGVLLAYVPTGQTTCTQGFRWDYLTRAWTGPIVFPFAMAALCEYERADGSQTYLIGGTTGWVREANVGTKDDVLRDGTGGSNVTKTVTIQPLLFGNPGAVKYLRRDQHLEADLKAAAGSAATLTVSWASEMGSGSVTIASKGAGVRDYRFRLAALGHRLSLTLTDTGAEQIEITGLKLEAAFGRAY